jgi:hypothetical protein
VRAGDAEVLYQALARLVQDGELREKMSHQAKQMILGFTPQRQAEIFKDVLLNL